MLVIVLLLDIFLSAIPQPVNLTTMFRDDGVLMLNWDAPSEAKVDGYRIYYATSSSTPQQYFDVKDVRTEIGGKK